MEFILAVVMAICIIYGYFSNIYKLFGNEYEGVAIKLVRIFGIFVPAIGVIFGFIDVTSVKINK